MTNFFYSTPSTSYNINPVVAGAPSTLFKTSITGRVYATDSKLQLVGLGDASNLTISLEKFHKTVAMRIPLTLHTGVANNLYFKYLAAENPLFFRITNDSIIYCNEAVQLAHDFNNRSTIEFIANENDWVLAIDGIPRVAKSFKQKITQPAVFEFELKTHSGDLEANFEAIALLTNDSETDILSQAEKNMQVRLESAIQESDYVNLLEILRAMPVVEKFKIDLQLAQKIQDDISRKPDLKWLLTEFAEYTDVPATAKVLAGSLYNSQAIIEVNDVSLTFNKNAHQRFKLSNLLLPQKKNDNFTALNHINFKAHPGDIIGILGANGAGKSTLLKAIAGLIDINEGEILIRGRHILLSPGLGMRPELSGRENIFLACCYMGLSPKQATALFDEIVDFSELADSIDQPFKFYSDGMKSRLVFSIATSIQPEILMLDEILGAGDIKFQQKASKRMDALLTKSKLVLLVTHSIQIVEKKCTKGLLISKGNQVYYGSPREAVARYLNELHITQHDLGGKTHINAAGFLGEMT